MTRPNETAIIVPLLAWTAIAIGVGAWFHPAVSGSDLWWHLATGREIAGSAGIPTVDSFSHTASGAAWMNHEWLWQLGAWGTYRIHPDALAYLNFALLLAVFGIAARVAERASGSLLAAGAVAWLAAAASHGFLDVRPHVVSLLFVVVFLLTRERRFAPWLWPPLFLVWVNLHSGFMFGIGMVGLFVLFRTFEASREAGRLVLPRACWVGLVASVLVIGLNPQGFEIVRFPLGYIDSDARFRSFVEWLPPGFQLDPRGFEGRFFWLLVVTAFGVLPAIRRSPFLVALAFVTALMALTSRRFIPLFALTAMPVAAMALAEGLEYVKRRFRYLDHPGVQAATALLAIAVALGLWSQVRFYPNPLYRWTQGELYPSGALAYLKALPNPPKHLLNLYSWGGFIMLHAPEIPVFIDGRANTVYDEATYEAYRRAYDAQAGYEQTLREYEVDGILATPFDPIAKALENKPQEWEVAYVDALSVLLLPRTGQPLPDPTKILAPGSDSFWLVHAAQSQRRGDPASAQRHFSRAIEANPLLIPAYSQLLVIAGQRGETESIERLTRDAQARYPRAVNHLFENAGRVYDSMGDLDRAIDSWKRARFPSPFRTGTPIEIEIQRLQARQRGEGGRTAFP